MAAILKNDRKMPFDQRKKFNPMFFSLFIPLTCIINEKINLPKKSHAITYLPVLIPSEKPSN